MPRRSSGLQLLPERVVPLDGRCAPYRIFTMKDMKSMKKFCRPHPLPFMSFMPFMVNQKEEKG